MNRSQSVLSVYSREENPMALQAPISSQRLGKADTKLVNRSKCTVYLVLFLSAVLCGTVAYFFMEDEDIRWYTAEVRSAMLFFCDEVFVLSISHDSSRPSLTSARWKCSKVSKTFWGGPCKQESTCQSPWSSRRWLAGR